MPRYLHYIIMIIILVSLPRFVYPDAFPIITEKNQGFFSISEKNKDKIKKSVEYIQDILKKTWVRVIIGIAVSLYLGHVFGGMFVNCLKIPTKGVKKGINNPIIKKIGKNKTQIWILNRITTDDQTLIYYGIKGRAVGLFERALFTTLYVLIDQKSTGTLGTLAIAWIGIKMTTYWIPVVTQEPKSRKKLSYAPFMATIISLLFALAGGMIIKNWAGINK